MNTNKFVAVLGLSANPIHLGHEAMARVVGGTGYFNEVWFMPCFDHRFKKPLAPARDRLEMCKIVVEDLGGPYCWSSFEIERQANGSTLQTVQTLKQRWPETKFFWVIGLDNALAHESWGDSARLRKEVPFWVVPRQGYEIQNNQKYWFQESPHTFLAAAEMVPDVSSTKIRELLRSGSSEVEQYLNPKVLQFVRNQMERCRRQINSTRSNQQLDYFCNYTEAANEAQN